MTAKEFIAKHVTAGTVRDFEALSNEDRIIVLEHLGDPCSRCGALAERWCCYDPPEDRD